MRKPDKCCDFGEFKCQIPMPINGKTQCIDFCVADIVSALNAANITTIASCCGHGKISGSIILDDGRTLEVGFNNKNDKKEPSNHLPSEAC